MRFLEHIWLILLGRSRFLDSRLYTWVRLVFSFRKLRDSESVKIRIDCKIQFHPTSIRWIGLQGKSCLSNPFDQSLNLAFYLHELLTSLCLLLSYTSFDALFAKLKSHWSFCFSSPGSIPELTTQKQNINKQSTHLKLVNIQQKTFPKHN